MTFTRVDLPLDDLSDVTFDEDGIIGRRSILPGGIRVLSELVPGQRSVSAGFWVGAGSRDESQGYEGSTHFLEHMLFKGTPTRTAQDISNEGDFLGGTLNAATSRQSTSYYGRVFSADLPQLLELLVDMLTHSVLDKDEMEIERGVILEELAASDDDVTEVAEHALLPLVLGDHPLARPVGGTAESVKALDHTHMFEHYTSVYHPSEVVFTATGDVDHDELCAMISALLNSAGWTLAEGKLPAPRRRLHDVQYSGGSELRVERPGRQTAIALGLPGLPLGDNREQTLTALNLILGGGPSSRLFQEIRERRGLAYSTYSWSTASAEGGAFIMEAQCAPDNAEVTAQIMGECLDRLAHDGVSQQEVNTAFNQYRAQLVFASESNGFRRSRLGQAELLRGYLTSMTTLLERARNITAEDIQGLAQHVAAGERSLVIVGPSHLD